MTKFFVAYPAIPHEVGEVIERAKTSAPLSAPSVEVVTWRRDDLGGQPLAVPILEAIANNDVVIADITGLNFNVIYELGYGIGLGKRGLPVVNSSLTFDEKLLVQIGIFDTLIYEKYGNSDELLRLMAVAQPGRRFATDYPIDPQPLYVVLPPVMTDDANQILARTARAGLRSRKYDPSEIARLSAQDAVRSVAMSNGVVLPLLAPQMQGSVVHNFRIAFVAGIAHALNKQTLILRKGDWPTPLDIRDYVIGYETDQQLATAISDFAARVHDERYASQLPEAGPDNKLATLKLGDPAAENEEETLSNYFVELDEFRQVLDGRANIAVGRKGSGKTAIFFQVRDRLSAARSNVILALNPEAYQLAKLKDLVLHWLAAGSKQFLLQAFWEYVLLLELCQKIIEKDQDVHKRNHSLFEPYQRLLRFYRLETSTVGISFSDRLVRLIDRISTRYKAAFGEQRNVQLTDAQLMELLHETTLHDLRRELINYTRNKGRIFILFDNIDKGWNASGLEDSDVIMVRTLLDAARTLTNDFRKADIDFRSVVFLRNDVYDLLVSQTPDRGKETMAVLDWKNADLLKQLIRRRLLYNSGQKHLSAEQLWHNICVPLVDGHDSLGFLLSRSMMRPRYLLQLINYCRGNAINFGRDRIDESDIEFGTSEYSSYVVNQISLEIRDVLPFAEEVLYVFLGESRVMKMETIDALLERQLKDKPKRDAVFSLMLWHGVIGYCRSKEEVTYIYDVNYDLKRLSGLVNKIGGNAQLQINPALWEGLELS